MLLKEGYMGYECILHYYEEISKGEYNKEESKTKSIKIGSPYEDIPAEILAGKLMAQLARKNMLIFDIEIFEFAKKKISYKETNDGILIKNKKFNFDDDTTVFNSVNSSFTSSCETIDEEEQEQVVVQAKIEKTVPAPLPKNVDRPIRYEIFNPDDPMLLNLYKTEKMPFTINKKYPIFSEKPAGNDVMLGMNYIVKDDKGDNRTVNDKFFTPIVRLSNDFAENYSDDIRLGGNFVNEQQLVIR